MQDPHDTNEAMGALIGELRAWAGWLADSGLTWLGEAPVQAPEAGPSAPGPGGADSAGPAPARRAPAPAPAASAPQAPRGGPPSVGKGAAGLAAVRTDLGDCVRCKLHGGRTHLVFGVGNPEADLVFVGEGPGREEDLQGEPFVGKAGALLDRMIQAMGHAREDVYICNVVKCRPPDNRDPEADEVAACEPFLKAQLAALSPKIIVGLGKFAVQTLRGDYRTGILRVRGRWFEYEGVPVMPTFHPAYLLRNPAAKREAWQDLQAVMARLRGEG